MKRALIGAAMLGALLTVATACGGGGGDDRNNEVLQSIPPYPGAIEIDRHGEDVDVNGEQKRVLRTQYATTDDKAAVQAFYGERLLRAGFRHDTSPDPTAPRDAIRFLTEDGQGSVMVTFGTQPTAWTAELGVTPGANAPDGAQTYYVVSVRAE